MHAAFRRPWTEGTPRFISGFHTAALIAAGMFLAAAVATLALIPRPGVG
jgi:hypothetical protein